MGSIRKPKRLTIRGDDEKEYMFLVKGGEDLRMDQRIEQVIHKNSATPSGHNYNSLLTDPLCAAVWCDERDPDGGLSLLPARTETEDL